MLPPCADVRLSILDRSATKCWIAVVDSQTASLHRFEKARFQCRKSFGGQAVRGILSHGLPLDNAIVRTEHGLDSVFEASDRSRVLPGCFDAQRSPHLAQPK